MANISRDTFDPTKGYRKVIHQQGGAVLDFDFNEAQDIAAYERERIVAQLAGDVNLLGSGGRVYPDTTASRSVKVQGGLAMHAGTIVRIPDVSTLKVFNDATTSGIHRTTVYVEWWDDEVTYLMDPDIHDPVFGESSARLRRNVEVKANIGVDGLPTPPPGHYVFKLATVTHDFDSNGSTILDGDIAREVYGLVPGDLKVSGAQLNLAPGLNVKVDNDLSVGGKVEAGSVILADGTVMTPALVFGSEPDSGFYRVTSRMVGLSLGGVRTFAVWNHEHGATADLRHTDPTRGAEFRVIDDTNTIAASFGLNNSAHPSNPHMMYLGTKMNIGLYFSTNYTERMRVQADGAVLIGKTSGLTGSGNLDVAGNANVDGNITTKKSVSIAADSPLLVQSTTNSTSQRVLRDIKDVGAIRFREVIGQALSTLMWQTATGVSGNEVFTTVLTLDRASGVFNFASAPTVAGSSVLVSGAAGSGISVSKSGSKLTITNTDRGSSQNIFKNIANAAGTTQFSATTNNDTLRFASGGILSLAFDPTNKRVTYSASLSAGTGISVSGNQITNTGIISAAAGSGINVSGTNPLTITNTDRGSSQPIFKRIGNESGTQQFAAGSNNDMLRFASGGILSLAFDSDTKKVTYSASLAAGTGISVSGNQITNTDRGSSQNIFKNIANAAGTTQFSAGANNDTLQFGAGGIVGVSFNPTNKRVTYSASLVAGTGISVSGNKITNTGIISAQAGAGISVSGKNPLQISNTDRGSSQNIFKNIANAEGTTQFSATTNNDTLRLEGGTNIAVSFDPATKKVTIAGTGKWGDADTVDGWHRDAIRNWNNLLNKPSTFPPSSHNHDWTEVTNKPAYATRWPSWTEVTSKPSTFPPSSHNHDDRYYTEAEADGRFLNLAGGTLTGTLHINDTTAANLENDGALTIGPTTSTNLSISGTTIVARNNGFPAPLHLNSGSGDVYANGFKVLTEQNRSEFAPSSHNHDNRYYTESEADGRFMRLNIDGQTVGTLTIRGGKNQLTLSNNKSFSPDDNSGIVFKLVPWVSPSPVYEWNIELGANADAIQGLVFYNGQNGKQFVFGPYGTAYAGGVWQDNAFDLAEEYDVTEQVEAGTVLTVDTEHDNRMAPTTAPYQVVTGVVSYHEAQLADNFGEIREKFPELNLHEYKNAHSVGITGLIPTKVTNEGGPIRRGDLLVSSSTPGHAMRCDPEIAKTLNPRFVVGVALQNFDGEQGVINVQR